MESRLKRQILTKTVTGVVCGFFLLVCLVGIKLALISLRFMSETGLTPQTALSLAVDSGVPLKEKDHRTNILILGVGGMGHEGGDLTDTMMIVSVNTVKKTMALISVPRDLWSDTLKDKVNTAYHYGEEKKTRRWICPGKSCRGRYYWVANSLRSTH